MPIKPVSQETAALHILETNGVDMKRVQRFYPHALRYLPDRLIGTIAALKELKVEPGRVINRLPKILSPDPRSWDAAVGVLRAMDLDVAKVIASCPAILSLPPATLLVKIELLKEMRLNPTVVLSQCPSALIYSKDRIRSTLEFLNSVGLDGARLISASPTVLCCSVDTKLRPIVLFVTVGMQREIVELQRNPACLHLSLNGRLKPRYAFATLHLKHTLGISTLFYKSDPLFCRSVGRPFEEYKHWLAHYLAN